MVSLVNKFFYVITLILTLIIFTFSKLHTNMNNHINYIITESNFPDSYDPLNADSSNNLNLMRMMYSTPIQINQNNELISLALKEFKYDNNTNTIQFTINDAFEFNNGTKLVNDDIILPILRVALKYPNFPVVKDIEGIENWRKLDFPLEHLPIGVKTIDQKIILQLTQNYQNPLFRFCLELFSIIPNSCIDRRQNKLNCNRPSESGFFKLTQENLREYYFTKRKLTFEVDETINANTINLKYSTINDVTSQKLKDYDIVSGNEINIIDNIKNLDPSVEITWLPSSRFNILLLNPNISPFDNSNNRTFFSNKVREKIKSKYSNFNVSKSFFNKLIPGYLEESAFKELSSEINSFKGKKFIVPSFSANSSKASIESIIEVATELEMQIIHLNVSPGKEAIQKFLNNEASFMVGSSGFWPQDPIGDISMFFTKNLHAPLKFVWEDSFLYKKISIIETNKNPDILKYELNELNLHIYQNSLISSLIHFKRFYIHKKENGGLEFPASITSPAPWQFKFKQ